MYRLLKPKNIHRALIGLILLAPILYLFGTQLSALAGAHGEELFAEPVYTQEYVEVDSVSVSGAYRIEINSVESVLSSLSSAQTFIFSYTFNDYSQSSVRFFTSGSLSVMSSNGSITYYLATYNPETSAYSESYKPWIFYTNEKCSTYVNFIVSLGADVDIFRLMDVPTSVVPENNSAYTDYLLGNMFGESNFLIEWGEDALSENRHGFAPLGELFKYVDDNILHLSDKQIGKMGYGYMYYVVHVLIFDIVAMAFVFIVTIPQKVLNVINDKSGGDL